MHRRGSNKRPFRLHPLPNHTAQEHRKGAPRAGFPTAIRAEQQQAIIQELSSSSSSSRTAGDMALHSTLGPLHLDAGQKRMPASAVREQ